MKHNKIFKNTVIATAVMSGLMLSSTAQAANWLMLQGTEPAAAAGRAKVWGFIQGQYQKDNSDAGPPAPNGVEGYIPPKLIGPDLNAQQQFNVNRARLGVRGIGMPLDSSVNYFLLAEFGNNGITAPGGGDAHITDASITFNTDVTRIRAGLFKTPGAEELLQAIHVFDYINFTTVSNQLMLERFPQSGDSNIAPPQDTPDANMGRYSRALGAGRDVGVQLFDSFKSGGWEHSYAVMAGNGNGLSFGDNDENMDTYLYWSSEMSYGGKGPRAEGLKLFAWSHNGKRTNAYDKTEEQDRKRSGVGVKYLQKPFRATFELMHGEGMIFQGQHRPEDVFNDEEADGYYLDFGYYIPDTNWELDLRIDSYTRGENWSHPSGSPTSTASDESTFDTTTIGAQYHINKKTRVNFEYSDRDFESDTPAVNNQLEGVDSRFAIQLTHIF